MFTNPFYQMTRKMNDKLKAFTLYELLLVMILISIVVTIIGAALYNVSGFHKRLKDKVDQVGSFKEVQYMIHRDFNRLKFYTATADQLLFTNGMDTVLYAFGDHIVRQQGVRTDSLSLQGALTLSDTTASITFLLGERKTNMRLPLINSGVLSYELSELEPTDAEE